MLNLRLPKFVVACVLGVTAMAAPAGAASPRQSPSAQVQFTGADRVVAFADVHGAYTELVTLLRETGIVDAQDHWAAGRSHVVSLGDLLDRGADSRKVMDLLMRLQGEAATAGGQLHVVLGNHEAMNLLGDLRYVAPGEYASSPTSSPPPSARNGARPGKPRRAPAPAQHSTRSFRPASSVTARRSVPTASTDNGCSRCRWRSR